MQAAWRDVARQAIELAPNLVKLYGRLIADRRVPLRARVLAMATLGYTVSPIDLIPDFVPFLGKRVPFLFFSAGENLDYHQPTDTADRIDYAKLLLEARAIRGVTAKILATPRPRFLEEPVCRIEEAASLEDVVGRMLEQKKKLQLSDAEVIMGQIFRASLKQVVESGKMTKPQRDQIVATCRLMVGMLQQKR